MAIATQWYEDRPAGNQKLKLSDDEIRSLWVAIRERMENMGVDWSTGAVAQAMGRLQCGRTGVAGLLNLAYADDGTTVQVAVRDSTHATDPSEVELGDGKGGSDPITLVAEEVDLVTLTTPNLWPVANAAQDTGAADSTPIASTWTTLESQAITTQPNAAGDVLILWRGTAWFDVIAVADVGRVDLRIRRDATPLKTWTDVLVVHTDATSAQDQMFPLSLHWLDTGATAATAHTYDVEWQWVTSGAGAMKMLGTTNERVLILQELRSQ